MSATISIIDSGEYDLWLRNFERPRFWTNRFNFFLVTINFNRGMNGKFPLVLFFVLLSFFFFFFLCFQSVFWEAENWARSGSLVFSSSSGGHFWGEVDEPGKLGNWIMYPFVGWMTCFLKVWTGTLALFSPSTYPLQIAESLETFCRKFLLKFFCEPFSEQIFVGYIFRKIV